MNVRWFRARVRDVVISSACCVLFALTPAKAEDAELWDEIEPGYKLARYELPSEASVLRSEVVLARFDPNRFSFHVSVSPRGSRLAITELVSQIGGLAGINANFFDEAGLPLGLILINRQVRQKIHAGGNVLTGVFGTDGKNAKIVHRSEVSLETLINAVQAGPRLISGGRPLGVASAFTSSRRSGVAITKTGEVIFFATVLRFPGASLHQIQQMLLDSALGVEVEEALNFDGGGSSQLFLQATGKQGSNILVSGGDLVPSAVVVKRR